MTLCVSRKYLSLPVANKCACVCVPSKYEASEKKIVYKVILLNYNRVNAAFLLLCQIINIASLHADSQLPPHWYSRVFFWNDSP